MSNILFIKTSSLGDVIHHMPALTDARRRAPDAHIAWVVEEAFAPLLRLHPAVSEVIPVATRRWRRSMSRLGTVGEMRAFAKALRARHYATIIDTQGLFRSSLIARVARGERHGFDLRSAREPVSMFYDVRHRVDRALHAVTRNRMLTGLALGYTPDARLDYGLDRARLRASAERPYAVLLHGTARREKLMPEEDWVVIGRHLAGRDLDIVLPWYSADEQARALRLAVAIPGARLAEAQGLDRLARVIAAAAIVVGVDTGLLHLAAAVSVPCLGLFVASDPGLTGPIGNGPIRVAGEHGRPPFAAAILPLLDDLLGRSAP